MRRARLVRRATLQDQPLQDPGAQPSPTHRSNSPVDGREQAGIARAAGGDQFQVDLGCSIEHHVIGRRVATQGTEMIDFSPQLMFEVMNDRACSRDRLWQVGAAKTIEGLDFEMLAKSETRVLWQESVMVVGQGAIKLTKLVFLAVADQ